MNRLTAALILSVIMAAFAIGLALAAPQGAAVPSGAAPVAADPPAEDVGAAASPPKAAVAAADGVAAAPEPQASSLSIWMSDEENGAPVRSVMSSTNQVWAVVAYEDAVNESYRVQLRDLSGIRVKSAPISANGTGRASAVISVTDFVNTYVRAIDHGRRNSSGECLSEACTMSQSAADAATNCQSVPPVPAIWPEPPKPTPSPGQPTPTPDPQDPYRVYRLWLDSTLNHVATTRQAMTEVTRTLQAMQSLPDVRDTKGIRSRLQGGQDELVGAFTALKSVEQELNPSDRRPDTDAGCRLIDQGKAGVDAANTAFDEVAPLLADTDDWRLPPTAAQWQNDRFLGCIQYQTNVMAVVDGQVQPSPRASVLWSVGEPGPPRLMFPSADLVERNTEGELDLALPEGANAIYAQSVTLPGINHGAQVAAYVTDAQCIPVDGITVTFGVNPLEAGSVEPVVTDIVNGVANANLEAGQDPQEQAAVHAFVSTGHLGPSPIGGPPGVSGSVSFQVIGPADPKRISFLMRQDRQINMVTDPTLAFSIQARDEFGRSVADGSVAVVTVPESDPAEIGYRRQSLRPARPTPAPELVTVGKSFEMRTRDGMTQLPASDDPGFRNVGPLLVCTGEGEVTLSVTIDGATANTNDKNALKTIRCLRRWGVYLPEVLQTYDVRFKPTALPIETATPGAPRP